MACGKGRGLRLRRFLSLTAVSLFIAGFRKRLRAFVRSRAGSCTPDRATGVAALALLPGRRLRLVRVCHAGKEVSSRGCEGTPCERRASRTGQVRARAGQVQSTGTAVSEYKASSIIHAAGFRPCHAHSFEITNRGASISPAPIVCAAPRTPRAEI